MSELQSGAAGSSARVPVTLYRIPDGVRVETDSEGWQWTDIEGAAVIAEKSRRTIHTWIANGWVTIRRTASGRPRIKIASLWQQEPAQVGQGVGV